MDLNRLRYIGDRLVGPDHPVFITGETAINHNGSLEDALTALGHGVKRVYDSEVPVRAKLRRVESAVG